MKSIREAGVRVKGCSHVTGGGFYENIPRMLPDSTVARIHKDSYPVPAIFGLLQKTGGIDEHVMYNTFNMGIGLCLAIDPADKQKVLDAAAAAGEKAYVVGEIVSADEAGQIDGHKASSSELDLFSDLLAAAYSKDPDFALEKIDEIKYYLHKQQIEVVDYNTETAQYFDMMPGLHAGTIRPAMVAEGKLLRKGVASAGTK